MFDLLDTVATARDGYEAFDCARAVALIGFLGLLSNFQDIIDDLTNGNGRRKRRDTGPESTTPLRDAMRDVLALWVPPEEYQRTSINSSDRYSQEEERVNDTQVKISAEKYQGTANPKLLRDLAEVGPQLALWLVDVADGRLEGDIGRTHVCKAIRRVREDHGWAGSMMSQLLTDTITGTLGKHTYSQQLLKDAGLLSDIKNC